MEGERLATGYLKGKYPSMKVTWMNEAVESGKPYDTVLNGRDHWSIEGRAASDVFYEVKTSRKVNMGSVPISANGRNCQAWVHASGHFNRGVWLRGDRTLQPGQALLLARRPHIG